MTRTASQPALRECWTSKKRHVAGEWLAPILAWAAVMAMLLAVVGVLLSPAE